MDKATIMVEGNREQMENVVMNNDDVLFHWCMLVTDISDTDAARAVLELLVNFWITICGFSFPSAGLELYKQSLKKGYNGQKLSEKIFTRYYSCKIILLHCK